MLTKFTNQIKNYFQAAAYLKPAEWVEKSIDLNRDKTAARGGKVDLSLTPYLIEPLNFFARKGRSEMTVMMPEQMGKTSIWAWGWIWLKVHRALSTLFVYPSAEAGEEINEEKLKPLMWGIPKLATELLRPHTERVDGFRFSDCVAKFQGAGKAIISFTAGCVIADEIDDWPVRKGKVHNLDNARKRGRTHPEFKLIKVCSPTVKNGAIAREYRKSSMGVFTLQCQNPECKSHTRKEYPGLTMPAKDLHNLQFDVDENGIIDAQSIRLVCPVCEYPHVEQQKRAMSLGAAAVNGGYIHRHPEKYATHAGFQTGALCSQISLPWIEIAYAQLTAGKSAAQEKQQLLDNSFKGWWFSRRRQDANETRSVKAHRAPLPDPDTLENVFFSSDTQDNGWYWVVRGIDSENNSYKLAHGFERTPDDLMARFTDEYLGHVPRLGVIDRGGHRAKEVDKMLKEHKNLMAWIGSTRGGIVGWKPSKDLKRTYICNPKKYQGELLYLIHTQTTDTGNNYWFLPANEESDYIEQIAAIRPPENKPDAEYEDWKEIGPDHLFDCEKMWLWVVDYAKKKLANDQWKIGELDGIRKPKKKAAPKAENSGSNWANGWQKF